MIILVNTVLVTGRVENEMNIFFILQLSADIVGVEMGRESNGKQFVTYLLNVGKGGSSWDVTRYKP